MNRETSGVGAHGGDEQLERGSREHYDDPIYYDYTYRAMRDDVAFYRQIVRKYGGPVLELGAGSGRIAIPVTRDGYYVTALDASQPMLGRARDRAASELDEAEHGRLTLVHGDMREFRFERRTFGTVIAPFNALLHLYEPRDFVACFRAVARHMNTLSRFVFDVRVPDPAELARNPERVYKGRPFIHPTLGHRVEYTETFRYDPIKQVQHVTIRFVPAKGSPRGAKPFETVLSQRQIFPNELRALLELGGLALDARYGDFASKPLGPDDALQIVVAKKT